MATANPFSDYDDVAFSKDVNHDEIYKSLQIKLNTYTGPEAGRADILWRLARTSFILSLVEELGKNDVKQVELLARQGQAHALAALTLSPEDPDVNTWSAVCLGRILPFTSSNKDKVNLAIQIKDQLDKAMAIRPADPLLRYMLGRWMYQMANLSWLERKLASIMFKKLPNISYDDAIAELTAANNLGAQSKAVTFYLAKCYGRKKGYAEAIKWLDIGIKRPGTGLEDDYYQVISIQLKTKYEKRL